MARRFRGCNPDWLQNEVLQSIVRDIEAYNEVLLTMIVALLLRGMLGSR